MSPNDWNDSSRKEGADGWVDEEASQGAAPTTRESQQPSGQPAPGQPGAADPQSRRGDLVHQRPSQGPLNAGDNGKALAILSHLSVLFGLPLFIIPLIQRDNALALHHAKAATVIYGMFMIAGLITVVTCGLGLPLIFLCYVPAIIGIVQATNEQPAGKWGMGDLGEQLLSGVDVQNNGA